MPCVDLVEAIMAIEHECEQRSAVVRGNYLVIVTVVTIIPSTITTGTMNSTISAIILRSSSKSSSPWY